MDSRKQYRQRIKTLQQTVSLLTEAVEILRDWGWHHIRDDAERLAVAIAAVVENEEG